MSTKQNKSPATSQAPKEYRVFATVIVSQDVEAASAEEAHRIAGETMLFDTSDGSLPELDPDVLDVEEDEFVRVGDETADDLHDDLVKACEALLERLNLCCCLHAYDEQVIREAEKLLDKANGKHP